MHRYNVVSQILFILTVIAFALAAPALVQEKRQAYVDVVQVPEGVRTVLKKRAREDELEWLWQEFGLRYRGGVQGNVHPEGIHVEPAPPPNAPPPNPAEVHGPVPPPNPAEVPEVHVPPQGPAGVYVPPPNPAEVHVPEVHVPPQGPADSDRELMELDGDAPPGSPQSGPSHSPPTSPGSSTGSEVWHTPPTSPLAGSSTQLDSDYWPTIPNARRAETQSEDLKAADSEMRGKAKVERRISGTATGPPVVLTW